MALAIKVEHLKKEYYRGRIDHHWFVKNLNRKILNLFRNKKSSFGASTHNSFYALNDVSFEIAEGESVGITGKNGAGKTTLLKILSRITAPSAGVVKINGRIASLLDLAAGFHPEMTGRENVFLIGAFLGMKKSVLHEQMNAIISFAELESHIDTPIKRYSAGMYFRLVFAVAINLEHKILLFDEIFAVGDIGFQEKCVHSIKDFIENKKKTVLFVSHNPELIKKICHRIIVMGEGRIVEDYRI